MPRAYHRLRPFNPRAVADQEVMTVRYLSLIFLALIVGTPSASPRAPRAATQGQVSPQVSAGALNLSQGGSGLRLRQLFTIAAQSNFGDRLGLELPEIEVSADDQVLIADPHHYRICRHDLTGHQQACFGEEGVLPGQFQGIGAMLLAPDGLLLVQDDPSPFAGGSRPGRLQRFTLEGELIDSRALSFYLAAVGPDGSLYGWTQARRLVRQKPTGETEEWGPKGASDPEAFSQGSGLTVDGRGHVFLAHGPDAQIHHYDAEGRHLASWGQPDSSQDAFRPGLRVHALPDGNLLVLCPGPEINDRFWVRRFTPEGRLLHSFRPDYHETDQLFGPGYSDVATASDGSILILSGGGDSILQRHSPEGQRLAVWLNKGSEGRWELPASLALFGNEDGSVRSIGRQEGMWVEVSSAGEVTGRGRMEVPPELAFEVTDVTRRPGGELCAVASSGDAWCFAADGSVRTGWRWSQQLVSVVASPSIVSAPDGTLWVSDPEESVLKHFGADGRPLGETGLPVPPELRFALCQQVRVPFHLGLAVAPDGTVVVAEQCSRPIGQPTTAPGVHRVSPSGEHLGRRPVPELLGLDPERMEATITDLAFTPSGALLLASALESFEPAPSNPIWLLEGEQPALRLDPGLDPSTGLPIQPQHLTMAGDGRLWTTRGEFLSDYGTLDAFALEGSESPPPDPSSTPSATGSPPPSAAPSQAPPSSPTPGGWRILLPWLER